jgi:hypothetical protein
MRAMELALHVRQHEEQPSSQWTQTGSSAGRLSCPVEGALCWRCDVLSLRNAIYPSRGTC